MSHKHADVVKAISEGKYIQVRSDGLSNWQDINLNKTNTCNPISNPELQWRVKFDVLNKYYHAAITTHGLEPSVELHKFYESAFNSGITAHKFGEY